MPQAFLQSLGIFLEFVKKFSKDKKQQCIRHEVTGELSLPLSDYFMREMYRANRGLKLPGASAPFVCGA
jgi:hypothetical protein